MSVFANRHFSILRSVFVVTLFSVFGALLTQYSPAHATNISSDFTNFIANERGRPASLQQGSRLQSFLDSGSLASVCSKSSSYQSGAVNKKDGGESYVSLVTWATEGVQENSADWRNKSNTLIQLLYGEIGGGMSLEYSAANNREGWCSYIVRMATNANIPITGKAVVVDNETESKSIETSTIGVNCSADFSAASKGVIGTNTEIATFLNELSTNEYNSIVKKYAVAITSQGPGASDCAKLVADLKTQIDRKVASHCEANPDTDECKEIASTLNESSSCVVEGVGWIICPITNFLAGISDAAFGVIQNFLILNVKLFDTSSGTYSAWSAFRNIANVAFVIGFLFIIFSQLTGQGVSNYGIKKTLPRLIIAAILVNISFFICQLAVDASQILGVGIREILKNVPIGSGSGEVLSWTDVMGDVLMGTGIVAALGIAAVAGAAILALSISLPVLLAVLLAILMTVIILIGRQAAIVILIVLAPLAFVAFMLPNTEQWFKRWYKIFIALLMVFPIVALLYGGGELASKIISSAANSGNTPGDIKFWLNITALAVAALPLILTPVLLKTSLNSLGTIGTRLSGIASKANARVRSTANTSSRYGEAKQGLKNSFALRRAKSRVDSKLQQRIDNSRIGTTLGLNKGAARAASVVAKEKNTDIEAAMTTFDLDPTINSTNQPQRMAEELEKAIISGDATKARAAQRVLLGMGNAGLSKLEEVYSKPSLQDNLTSKRSEGAVSGLRSDLASAGIKGKNNALATYSFSDKGADSFDAIRNDPSTYQGLNAVELAGQSADNLQRAAVTGGISQTMARAVLDNSSSSGLLDGKKRAIFESIANGSGGASGAGGSGTGSSTQTTYRPQAWTQAQARAQAAAQGHPTGQAGDSTPSGARSAPQQSIQAPPQSPEQGTPRQTSQTPPHIVPPIPLQTGSPEEPQSPDQTPPQEPPENNTPPTPGQSNLGTPDTPPSATDKNNPPTTHQTPRGPISSSITYKQAPANPDGRLVIDRDETTDSSNRPQTRPPEAPPAPSEPESPSETPPTTDNQAPENPNQTPPTPPEPSGEGQ